MKTAYDDYKNIQVIRLPEDKEAFEKNLWTIQDAAKHWDVHYTTAKRLIERHAEELQACKVMIRRPHGSSVRTVIRAGSERPSAAPPGNPQFRNPELQRERALERWDKEMTEAQQIDKITNEVYLLNRSKTRLRNIRANGILRHVNFAALEQRITEAEKRIGVQSVAAEIEEIEKALDDH